METTLEEPVIEKKESEPTNFTNYKEKIEFLIKNQKDFYRTGVTRSFNFRKTQLEKLRKLVKDNEKEINEAIQDDLGRSDFIVSFTTGGVITEINYMLEHVLTLKPFFVSRRLKRWMKKTKHRSPQVFLGDKAYVQPVPKGVVLIMAPWNYPFLLLMKPLIGAIAAGNCAIVKPSEVSVNTARVIEKLINENFDPNFIHAETGGVSEAIDLSNNSSWDHIFFTGGTEIGRAVYQAAAKNLIPVTLELGGKSPTIVDKDIYLNLTARRLVQTKFLNAGQTCMAPDYLLVHKDVVDPLTKAMQHYFTKFFGQDIEQSKDFARIISDKQFNRLIPQIKQGDVVFGGKSNSEKRFIEPTLVRKVDLASQLMKEEVFGPILPIVEYETDEEVINFIESRQHPLALYIYTKNKKFKEKILTNTNFGGAMINESVLYYLHPEIPFGGKGESGLGNYSGKYSFDTFSQQRPVIEAGTFIDRFLERSKVKAFRYPPYKKLNVKLLKLYQRTFSRFRT